MQNEKQLRQQQEQYQLRLKNKMRRIFGVIGTLIGLYLIWGGLTSYLNPDKDIKDVKLQKIYGTVSIKPERQSPGRGEYIGFGLKEYPAYIFSITGFGLNMRSREIINEVNIGDSLLIFLDNYNYDKLKKKPGRYIEACVLRTREKVYLSWDDYAQASVNDNRVGIIMVPVGIALCIFYVISFVKSFKQSDL